LQNLHYAFPEITGIELLKLREKTYRHFTDIFIQTLKILAISSKEARKRVYIRNPEFLRELYEHGKSAIVLTGHVGNWEWMAFLPLHIKHQFISFYQRQSNAYFNKLSLLMRQRFGNHCVESRSGYKVLMEYKKKNIPTLTYVIADQRPRPDSSVSEVPFFGRPTKFLAGAEVMAERLGHELLYAKMTCVRLGYYEVEYIPIAKDASATAAFAGLLEENIKAGPEYYLWTHKRWKGYIDYSRFQK
jgi:KDO2-lipid IV(A) lauroyltransferase